MKSLKVRKTILKTALIVSIFANSLNAGGLEDFIQNNLNGAIETTNPGYFKTQTGGLWYGGDMKIRWDMSGSNINLFHATLPSFSVGCNGIDATFGAFSYLGFQQLVDKLKKIAAAAPAMAFQMAIMTMCEQCNTIMSNLEKITDAINNFNMNGCQASSRLAKLMYNGAQKAGLVPDRTAYTAKSSKDEEWAFTKAIEGLQQKFGSIGAEGFQNKLGHGSVINKTADTYKPSFMTTADFTEIMRGLLGDVYGFDIPQKDSSNANEPILGKFMYIQPSITSIGKFLKKFLYGGDIKGIKLTPKKNAAGNYLPPEIDIVNINIPQDKAFVTLFKNKIKSIIQKIQEKQPLSTQDINFINSMPIPLYNIANVVATANISLPDDVAKYLALKAARMFVIDFYQQIIQSIGSLLKNPDYAATSNKEVLAWMKQTGNKYKEAITLLNERLQLSYKRIKMDKNIINQYKQYQEEMIKNSPIWASLGL